MKKILNLLFALLLLAAPAWGATHYVDGACTFNGNGADGVTACASSGGASGPYNSIESAIDGTLAAGDVIRIRGVHSTHGSNHAAGTFDGRYSTNDWITFAQPGSSGNPIILENNGYDGTFGSGEATYIEGTTNPSGTWTKCDSGCTGTCTGVPTPCLEVWYVTGSGSHIKVLAGQKPDGAPTRRQTSLAGVTAQFASYSNQTTLWVRWGSGGDTSASEAPYGSGNLKPYVLIDNNGEGLDFGFTGDASYWTVRGLTIRTTRRFGGILVRSRATEQTGYTFKHNTIKYVGDVSGNGADYGIVLYNVVAATIEGNDISHTGSEGIHTQAVCANANCSGAGSPCACCTGVGTGTCSGGATVLTITGNYIHHTGDRSILGPDISGTPWGSIFGDAGGGSGNGNYAGSVLENNFYEEHFKHDDSHVGGCVVLENNANNWVIRNNVFKRAARECVGLHGMGGTGASSNEIYNNLFIACGYDQGASVNAGIYFSAGSAAVSGNSLYNNTFYDQTGAAVDSSETGTLQNNLIRNNIMYDPGSQTMVLWKTTDSTNKLEYNLIVTSAATAVTWLNINRACSALSSAGTGNIDNCPSPVFVNAGSSDFHIQTTSPAKDAGTATGMPAGRTTDITNTLAALHGLPDYNDADAIQGGIWDMGADEFTTASPPDERKRRLLLKVGGKK